MSCKDSGCLQSLPLWKNTKMATFPTTDRYPAEKLFSSLSQSPSLYFKANNSPIIPSLAAAGGAVLAITGKPHSWMGKDDSRRVETRQNAEDMLEMGKKSKSCPNKAVSFFQWPKIWLMFTPSCDSRNLSQAAAKVCNPRIICQGEPVDPCRWSDNRSVI